MLQWAAEKNRRIAHGYNFEVNNSSIAQKISSHPHLKK